jgi:hypothetical protein
MGRSTKTKTNIRTHKVPTTPEQVLKRIMHDMSTHLRRSKETYILTKELPKFPMVDYEELRRIVQANFQYLGVQIRKWKRDNT